MSAENEPDKQHVPIRNLWDYRTNTRRLSPEELLHLSGCNHCLSHLGLCQLSQSWEEVQRRLMEIREQGKSAKLETDSTRTGTCDRERKPGDSDTTLRSDIDPADTFEELCCRWWFYLD
jgi:hypothetical protein